MGSVTIVTISYL